MGHGEDESGLSTVHFDGVGPGPGEGGGAAAEVTKIARPDPGVPRYDKLTVFQAAPLVYRDDDEDELNVIEMLDFDQEREILSESLREAQTTGAEIDLVFETATMDRLGAFLATSDTQVLHFSCHGNPEFLCIEDGSGGAQFLRVDDLRELMSAGSGELLFVFVSACYSRAAGEAFIKAGVPHVVCCQHDEPLMDRAAQEFSRNFYLSLACGNNLKQSFELGRQAVKLCPKIPDAANEMGKFLLLPEDANHDEPIFFTKPRKSSFGSKMKPLHSLLSYILPPPPEVFVAREMDMYKVIQSLWRARLVKITGCPGSGKASLASAVARYISIRERTFPIDEVIWLPLIYTTRIDKLSSCFFELFAMLQDESPAMRLQLNDDYRRVCGTVVETLYQTKALVVIETQSLVETQGISKLSIFLQDLFRGTKYVRVILVCQQGFDVSLRNSVVQSDIFVEPLDFEDSATLFGRLCPLVSDRRCSQACTPRQLCNLLVPKGKETVKLFSERGSLSKRSLDIFELIGGGVPSRIHACAREMSTQEFDKLIEIGERIEYNSDCKTRVELEKQLGRLGEELQVAVRQQNFKRANEIQGVLDELERQREALPEIEELRRIAGDLKQDMENAVQLKNFSEAENLSQQVDLLNKKIEEEQKALLEFNADSKPSSKEILKDNDWKDKGEWLTTRAGLESELQRLQNELEEAVEKRDFPNCRRLQALIDECEARRESLPSLNELSSKIAALNIDLNAAVASRNFAEAEKIHQQIQEAEKKLAQEKESEDNFVSMTAIRLGKQLTRLGEELEEAVNNHDVGRAKEIEECILKEIKQMEEKFTLHYGVVAASNGRNNNQEAEDSTGLENSREERDGRSKLSSGGSSDSPPSSFSAETKARLPSQTDSDVKEGTVAGRNPHSGSFARGGETKPGVVAVSGLNESPRDESGQENLGALLADSIATEERSEKDESVASSCVEEDGAEAAGSGNLTERIEQGLCPTCPGPDNPTQCFVFKNSRNNPRMRTRIPLTVEGLVHEGKCLICNPGSDQRQGALSSFGRRQDISSSTERRTESENEERLEAGTESSAPVPVHLSRVPPGRVLPPAGVDECEENEVAPAAEIAVATRVDAVAQEEVIERMVRDAIRRVTDGNADPPRANDGQNTGNGTAGRHLGPDAFYNHSAESTEADLSRAYRRPRRKPFFHALGKFGKRKHRKR